MGTCRASPKGVLGNTPTNLATVGKFAPLSVKKGERKRKKTKEKGKEKGKGKEETERKKKKGGK